MEDSHAGDAKTLTSAGRARRFGLAVRALFRIFKQPSKRMEERREYAPTDDAIEKIVSLASEITGQPADAASITRGQKYRSRNRAGMFDAVAYQRAKQAKRLAKRTLPSDSPAWFDPQLPVS